MNFIWRAGDAIQKLCWAVSELGIPRPDQDVEVIIRFKTERQKMIAEQALAAEIDRQARRGFIVTDMHTHRAFPRILALCGVRVSFDSQECPR